MFNRLTLAAALGINTGAGKCRCRKITCKEACQGDSSGGRKKLSDLGYIFRVEMIVFADILDMRCRSKNSRIWVYKCRGKLPLPEQSCVGWKSGAVFGTC